MDGTGIAPDPPPPAAEVFGSRLADAERFAELLAGEGTVRGLIGPREVPRLWDRHLLNSAVVGEAIPDGARVLDVGSGAGLPGIALALARPDLEVALVEPMARRVAWLDEVVGRLGLPIAVHRGRAESADLRAKVGRWDVVTARAVAPLGRLAGWCLPLLTEDGRLIALKGERAQDEVERDAAELRANGAGTIEVVRYGHAVVRPATTVVLVGRAAQRRGGRISGARRRNDR